MPPMPDRTRTFAPRWLGWFPLVAAALSASAARAADESFVVKDAGEFAKCVDVASAKVEKLAGGMSFVEGPVWVPAGKGPDQPAAGGTAAPAAGGYLVFSDIPADALMKWSAAEKLTVFRKPADLTMVNGNALDAEGRLVHASHMKRALLRTERDGTVATIADAFDGKKFNSPNDIAIRSDGSIWFTDPPYGLPKGVESELGFRGVFRLDARTRKVSLVAKDMLWPNGIAFSPDEKVLYVAVSDPKNAVIRAYDVPADGEANKGAPATNGRDVCKIDAGVPDGIRVDADGRIWSSADDGVQVFSPAGKLLGKIRTPETAANLCFGGPDGRTLFITAKSGLYAVKVRVASGK